MWRQALRWLAFVLVLAAAGEIGFAQGLTGSLGLHDPSSVIQLDGTYYLFYTRSRLGSKTSTDRIHWEDGPRIFPQGGLPDWHEDLVPANQGSLWAPDVAFFDGEYHLYYSVSSFGSQDSAIGLATSPTLDPDDPNYTWTDQGPVIESGPGQTPFNAIDPAILQTSSGKLYMSFGSFWEGIYRVELDPSTGKPISGRDGSPRTLAKRAPGGTTAIEAPYIYERDVDDFFLFVNWDSCCNGVNSTYNIRVGRSASATGPFVDRDGVPMANGGGTLFLATEGEFIGPGHASIFTDDDGDWFGYHYYDGNAGGASRYNLRNIYWDAEGWPTLTVSAAVPGDYNNDGNVNAADYVVFRNHLNTEFALPNRNPALSGPVGQGDYEYWVANFGNSGGRGAAAVGAASVPESGSASLAVLLTIAMCPNRGFRSRL